MPEADPRDTATLMRAFAKDAGDEEFSALVERFGGVAYGAALRRCGGDRALAADVVQDVFAKFARQMPRLRAGDRIGAWLHRAATYRAGDLMKSEQRRKRREEQAAAMQNIDRLPEPEAWEALSPVLDQSLARLRGADREALVLRYLEGRGIGEVARSLKVSEAAAQKRIERAVERLREKLGSKGFVVGIGLLASGMGNRAGAALPEGLAAKVVAAKAAPVAWFWPSPKWAALGAVAALVAGGVPLILRGEQTAPAFLEIDGRAAAPTGEVVEETRRVPVAASAMSFEELIEALGELHRRPLTVLDRKRRSVYLAMLGTSRNGEALLLSEKAWETEVRARADSGAAGYSHGSFRHEWCKEWGRVEPERALEFAISRIRIGAKAWRNPASWGEPVSTILFYWSSRDAEAAWAWVERELDAGRLRTMPEARLASHIAYGFGERLSEGVGAAEAIERLLVLQVECGSELKSTVLRWAIGALATSDELRRAIRVVREKVPLIEARNDTVELLLGKWGKVDWGAASAWIGEHASSAQRAELGWALGFPPVIGAEFDAAAHVDGLIALQPKMSQGQKSIATQRIMDAWFWEQPSKAADKLIEQGWLGHDVMVGVIRHLRRPGKSVEWRAAAVRLLRACDPEVRRKPEEWSSFQVGDEVVPTGLRGLFEEMEAGE